MNNGGKKRKKKKDRTQTDNWKPHYVGSVRLDGKLTRLFQFYTNNM
jgi:hypothetical protein